MNVVIGGISHHVEICGDGFPLVLLHGFTGDSSTWSPFLASWGKHSRLIIPDIIGHGKTESPEELPPYHIESAAQALNSILDVLNLPQVDMLGYSMGGRLALTFAILYPERVRKLILESASPGLLTAAERKQRLINDGELAHFIYEKGIEAFVEYWEEIPLFSSMKRLPLSNQESIRKQRLQNSAKGLANSLLGMGTGAQPSWWEKLDLLPCDVLLLTGKEDKKFCGIAEAMAGKLKMVSWIAVENSGHAIHVEEREKFGTIVSDFIVNT